MGEGEFKLYLPKTDFLNRVYSGNFLERQLRDVEAVISPRDVGRIMIAARHVEGPKPNLTITFFEKEALADFIRSTKDSSGREVYQTGRIVTGRIQPSLLFSFQTFAQQDKLVGIHGLKNLFGNVDNPGIGKMPACIMRLDAGSTSYVAIYVPPIVEHIPCTEFKQAKENFEARMEHEDGITLPAVDGNGALSFRVLHKKISDLLDSKPGLVLQVVRDGVHRIINAEGIGTTMHTITINGAISGAPSIPIELNDVIITLEKPKKREDRFLGLVEGNWVDLKGRGIDG
jgi:hypothetical protein